MSFQLPKTHGRPGVLSVQATPPPVRSRLTTTSAARRPRSIVDRARSSPERADRNASCASSSDAPGVGASGRAAVQTTVRSSVARTHAVPARRTAARTNAASARTSCTTASGAAESVAGRSATAANASRRSSGCSSARSRSAAVVASRSPTSAPTAASTAPGSPSRRIVWSVVEPGCAGTHVTTTGGATASGRAARIALTPSGRRSEPASSCTTHGTGTSASTCARASAADVGASAASVAVPFSVSTSAKVQPRSSVGPTRPYSRSAARRRSTTWACGLRVTTFTAS